MTNFYDGLARGPLDHESSSAINVISEGTINMGSAVVLNLTTLTLEILPRVQESPATLERNFIYGIAVGGDLDGFYGDGVPSNNNDTLATNTAGQGVVVVTQGRCLARVEATVPINIGDPLGSSQAGAGNEGALINVSTLQGNPVIARALKSVAISGFHMIPVDVQREAIFDSAVVEEMGYEDGEEMGYEDTEEMEYG